MINNKYNYSRATGKQIWATNFKKAGPVQITWMCTPRHQPYRDPHLAGSHFCGQDCATSPFLSSEKCSNSYPTTIFAPRHQPIRDPHLSGSHLCGGDRTTSPFLTSKSAAFLLSTHYLTPRVIISLPLFSLLHFQPLIF